MYSFEIDIYFVLQNTECYAEFQRWRHNIPWC